MTFLALALLASPPAPLLQTWTVDDDGFADFASPAEAVASNQVVDGGVLLVDAGDYGDFVIDKAVRLIAASGTTFDAGAVTVRDVAEFHVAGMRAEELVVERVPGRIRIDQCEVGDLVGDPVSGLPLKMGSARFEDCDQLMVTRSDFVGTDSCETHLPNTAPAAVFVRTRATLVDSNFQGGSQNACFGSVVPGPGRHGLELLDGSDVVVAGCTILGGNAAGAGQPGGTPVWIEDSSARVRGTTADLLLAGFGSPLALPIDGPQAASAEVSGVALVPGFLPDWVDVLAEPYPTLRVTGAEFLGATKSAVIYGPFGKPAVLFFGLQSVITPHPLGEIWIAPSSAFYLVPIVAAGPTLGSGVSFQLPTDPAVAGLGYTVQAWFPPAPAPSYLTNAVDIVLRW